MDYKHYCITSHRIYNDTIQWIFSLQEASQDQIFQSMVDGNASLILTQSLPNNTKLLKSEYNPNNDRYININTELKPMLEKRFELFFLALIKKDSLTLVSY